MGEALATPRDSIAYIGGASVLRQDVQVRVWANKDALFGAHIGIDGVKVHGEKIWAIWDWPDPRDVTMLRGFLGICTYYQKFMKGFAPLAIPLIDLTKKGAFAWIEGA